MRSIVLVVPVLAVAAAGCAAPARPARFYDAPAVTEVSDDAPIGVPRPTPSLKAVYLSEVLLHRSIVVALDPLRVPTAGDVNALDEVPRSSWFDPDRASADATASQPADAFTPPLKVIPRKHEEYPFSLQVRDAHGDRYELALDSPDRPEMRTGAAIVASRLVRELGYLVPTTELVDVPRDELVTPASYDLGTALAKWAKPGPDGLRAVAVRWPPGVDLGPTAPSTTRYDDANDRVDHRDRRTLRALKVVGAWLGLTHLDALTLRDAYVGEPGRGHVEHYVVGLDGALGADDVVRPDDQHTDKAAPNPWVRLFTLGLYDQRTLVPTPSDHPALGEYTPEVDLAKFKPHLPFDPIARAQPADDYWAAKRIAAIPRSRIEAAVDAARYSDPVAKKALVETIEARRGAVLAQAFGEVTPLEVERVGADAIVLRDEAVRVGLATSASSRYEIAFVDDAGHTVESADDVAGEGALVSVRFPKGAKDRHYLVLRVTSVRGGDRAPRAASFHVALDPAPHVVGVRH